MLYSKRLFFRQYTDADLIHLLALYTDWQWQNVDEAFVQHFLHHTIKKQYEIGGGVLAVFLKETDTYIGHCGIKYVAEKDEWFLSFRFIKAFWCEDLPAEAINTCVQWGFRTLCLKEIVLDIAEQHRAVIKTISKAGFKFRYTFKEYDMVLERYSVFS
jgi:[ribosomal protein S5]-alanine N-acetyltransferase